MEEKIMELYKLLEITPTEAADYPHNYDNYTPFEKCALTINVPTTIGNGTTFVINRNLTNT
ncbi:MAG: hypothetical protein LBS97_00505 [Treponema sp.]|jgi:hypothetical protein|nr:hypothetical protein [Treponema sp.]